MVKVIFQLGEKFYWIDRIEMFRQTKLKGDLLYISGDLC